jgi:nicotinic acid mononucleotide adenylyltransferase
VILCPGETPAVSASEVRRAVAAGDPITGMVPEPVERYIKNHHLYAG